MVAIAAACQGLSNFASGRVSSALVRAMDAPPGIDALAPHWLGHVTGGYDHAAQCADLLKSLARYYEQDLSSDLHGMPIPSFQWPRDEPDLWSIVTPHSYIHGCTTGDAYDPYRWKLFDVPLDDASVIRWSREAYDWVEKGWATERP